MHCAHKHYRLLRCSCCSWGVRRVEKTHAVVISLGSDVGFFSRVNNQQTMPWISWNNYVRYIKGIVYIPNSSELTYFLHQENKSIALNYMLSSSDQRPHYFDLSSSTKQWTARGSNKFTASTALFLLQKCLIISHRKWIMKPMISASFPNGNPICSRHRA